MGFLICVTRKGKAKLHFIGDAVSAMTVASVVGKATAEKISKEKGIDRKNAMNLVIEGILESQNFIK